jgi:ribosomal protein L40E
VESSRCPSCAALVPAGAPWCGQCYADLRPPAPELDPLTAPLAAVEAGLAAPSPLAPLTAPAAVATVSAAPATPTMPTVPAGPVAAALPDAPAAPEATPAPATGSRASWPCLRCQHLNDVDDDACRRCGGGFLAGVEQADIALPGIGRASAMERSHKIALIVAGSAVLMLFLLGMSIIVGSLV